MNAGRSAHLSRKFLILITVAACVIAPRPAAAQSGLGKFLSGAAVALVAHESGHLLLDTVFDAGIVFKRINAGPFPFFAITHDPVSPAREFAISSAGFWVQHASNELILTRRPDLRRENAPFLKGLLAFNVLTSTGYSVVAFSQRGPGERDTRGMAAAARVAEPWVGLTVLAPAVLDATRYYRGDVTWLKWVSRATKVGGALLIIRTAQ